MEPVTHVLTGACLSRAGLNRRAAYATAAMAIAAEFPDIDTLWGLRGPVSGFQHHRGITHTFLGVPFEAALILLGFVLFHRLRNPAASSAQASAPASSKSAAPAAPVRWGVLYLLLLLALLSHLLLDYTNNYGLRPFFPFDDRWFAGSFVFIFDPLLFAMLLAGLLLPSLFGLIGREIGVRRERFRGRGWARAALAGVALLWSVRWVERGKAVQLAQAQTLRAPGLIESSTVDSGLATEPGANSSMNPAGGPEPAAPDDRPLLIAGRSLASPDPLSVFRWYTVTDFGPAYRLGVADTRLGTLTFAQILNKPPSSATLSAAEQSRLGRVYLDWSPMPFLSVADGLPEGAGRQFETHDAARTVTFSDPRFMGGIPQLQTRNRAPLSGWVVLDRDNHVLAEAMDGRFGR